MKYQKFKLGELYTVHNGLSKSAKYFGEGYPFISFSTVFNNYFLPEVIPDFVQSTDQEQKNYSVKRGDIFITRTSETSDELGMSCVALKDVPTATYNGFTKRLRPIIPDRVLPEFIGYYLRLPSFRANFQSFSTMTTRASLKNEELLNLEINLPTIKLQKKISEIIREYDFLIENNNKQIKLLEESLSRLFHEWFVKYNFPTQRIINGKKIDPKKWEQKSLDTSVEILSGYAFKSKDFDKEGNYKIVTIKNVKNGIFDTNKFDRLSFIPSNMPDYCNLHDGDMLLSLTGNVGRVCLVTGNNYLLNQRVAKIKSDIPAYMYCLFRSRNMYCLFNNLANGAAQQNLSPIRVGKIKHFFPEKELIYKFEQLTQPMIKKILIANKEISSLLDARNSIIPNLMNVDNLDRFGVSNEP